MYINYKDLKTLLNLFFTDEVVHMLIEVLERMSLGCNYELPEEKVGMEAFKFKKE